jgi:branched-chain amino acid transport system ATP-binding protein
VKEAKTVKDTPLVRTQEITMRFGGVVALSRVNFEIRSGEIVGLIGPNGAGKTTLFNILTGVLRPTAGRVTVLGHNVTGWRPHRIARLGVGRTFQIPAPFTKATVLENLMVAASGSKAESLSLAHSLLDMFDLDGLSEERAESLDSGHLRLLELARVLMRDPQVILLDEPTSGVDLALLGQLLERIHAMHAEGRAICVVAHDMRAIEDVCERVVVLDQGQVIAEGSFHEVRQDPNVVDAYLGGTARTWLTSTIGGTGG